MLFQASTGPTSFNWPVGRFLSCAILQSRAVSMAGVDHRHIIAYLHMGTWLETLWDPTNLDTKFRFQDVIINSPDFFVLGSHSRFSVLCMYMEGCTDLPMKGKVCCAVLCREPTAVTAHYLDTLACPSLSEVTTASARRSCHEAGAESVPVTTYCSSVRHSTLCECDGPNRACVPISIHPLHPLHLQAAGRPMSLPVFKAYLTTTCFLDRQLHNPVSFHDSHPHLSVLVLLPIGAG
ncbi:hypothetical protein F4679DRAFT_187989 [Xylaria curta]|nr:hypothetical protein F4679DRAFT_187989 [Xylaria curta]